MFETQKKKKKTPVHIGSDENETETAVALPKTADLDLDSLIDSGEKAARKRVPEKKQEREEVQSPWGRCGC